MPRRQKRHAIANTEDLLIRNVRAKGKVSRGELAQILEMVPSTVGIYVERLVREGFLLETIADTRGVGRPPILLELNPQRGRFIGIDFDAQHAIGVTTDFCQNVLQHADRQFTAPATADEVLQVFAELIEEFLTLSQNDILGIGIGLPGFVDHEQGVGLRSVYLRDWKNVPVASWLQERFGIPVWVENNLRAISLGEYWLGSGRGLQSLVCLGSRTGLALGIVMEGQLYRGANHCAGEIGLWNCPSVIPHGNERPTLDQGTHKHTLQEVASLSAILNEAWVRISNGESSSMGTRDVRPTAASLIEGVEAGDPLACELLTRIAVQHAWILHQVSRVLDPDLYVLVGPLVDAPEYYQTIVKTCRDWNEQLNEERIVTSQLGEYGGAIGAVSVALQSWAPRHNPE